MTYNQIIISSGHSINCQGASDIINEVTEAKRVVNRVRDYVIAQGKSCYTYHDTANSSSINLANIVAFHNRYGSGIDVSVHFNASSHTNSARGVEVLYYSNSMASTAAAVSSAISKASGLINRGAKQRTNLYVLKHTDKPAILIEVAFVDSVRDVELYRTNFENICKAICDSLTGSNSSINVPNTEVSSTPVASTSNPVAEAKKFVGTRCKELQGKLIKLGYDCGGYGADGDFGQGTYHSLVKFQKDNGLVADGLAGEKTFAKLDQLIASKAVVANKPTTDNWVKRLQSECNAQGFSNQVVDGIAGTNTLNGCPTLKQGSKGNITKLLQEKLGISADGIFGSNTKAKVISYQKSVGLGADGVVGRNTWKKLLKL